MKHRGWLSGLLAGVGVMYFLDTKRGSRRRALIHDKVVHYRREGTNFFQKTSQDLWNRIRGTALEFRSSLKKESLSDEILEARIRSKLGHVYPHSREIGVKVNNGSVLLRGKVKRGQGDQVIQRLSSVHGVRKIAAQWEA